MTCPQRPWAACLPAGLPRGQTGQPTPRRQRAHWRALTILVAALVAPALSLGAHAQTVKARTQAHTQAKVTKAEAETPPAPAADLDPRAQQLKSEALALGRDLLVLEEEGLFPAASQVTVFLSMNVAPGFVLDSVQVRLDGRLLVDRRHAPREAQALQRGGVQRLYRGPLKNGRHEIVAGLTGQDPRGRDYQRQATVTFDKVAGPGLVELRIVDPSGDGQPELEIKSWAPSAKAAQAVKALHQGQARFHLFQDQHFSALTGLMAAQQLDRLTAQDDETELLRGRLLLSYGLHHEAARVFAALIERGAALAVRDRAWLSLAQGHGQRGSEAEGEAALARIEGPLPPALAEERDLLRAQWLMARGRYADAVSVLGALPAAHAGAVARFNLGVALIKSGERDPGLARLDHLGRSRADNEEERSVRDRANLALGVAALKQRRADDARRLLERVRLGGVDANKALLGLGWAAIAQGQPALALVPWHELAARDASDPAVLEVLLAIPFAHAELGVHDTALTLYEQALAAYGAEGRRLAASVAANRAGRLLQDLLERFEDKDRANADTPHAAHLSQLLAQPEFQLAFERMCDLHALEKHLRQWHDALNSWRQPPARAPMPGDEAARFERGTARIDALDRRLDAMLPRVTALKSEQQIATARIAAAALARLQERLQAYAAQAHFEIAQLIDRSAAERPHDRATH